MSSSVLPNHKEYHMPEEATAPVVEQEQPEAPEDAPQVEGTSAEESFTDSYNPNAVEDEAARAELEKAYKQLQSDYSKKTAEISSQRQEAEQAQALVEALRDPNQAPDLVRQLAQQHGIELPETEDEEYLDPDTKRLNELEQWKVEQEELRQQQELEDLEIDYITERVEAIEQKEGHKLTEDEFDAVAEMAVAHRIRTGEKANVDGAWERLKALGSASHERYLESKKAPKVPVGSAGEKQIDLSDDEARRDYMKQIMAEGSEQ